MEWATNKGQIERKIEKDAIDEPWRITWKYKNGRFRETF